ncbi:MAG: Smr/MutS family protein [Oligoflexales bacterium]
MGKKRKNKNIRELSGPTERGVNFDLEEDADELFSSYLDAMDPLAVLSEKEAKPEESEPAKPSRNSKSKARELQIDLHGYALADAIYQVDCYIQNLLKEGARIFTCKIITGKGRHSGPEGGVLAKEIHSHVRDTYRREILRIEESPADATLNGLPLKGYFNVTFSRKGK